MPVEIRVPPLGESVTEATVASWLKHEGDVVEAGEPLVELETDKVNVDVAAERSGVLTSIVRAAGETVQPGDILAMVAESGEAADGAAPTGDAAGAAATNGAAAGAMTTGSTPATPESTAAPRAADRPHASPLARRMAEEHDVDLGRVSG